MKLVIEKGQRLKVGEEWKTEGQTVTVEDAYKAAVLIESGVAREK
jgi:hypothetical protein